jgi:hypothetical protein
MELETLRFRAAVVKEVSRWLDEYFNEYGREVEIDESSYYRCRHDIN